MKDPQGSTSTLPGARLRFVISTGRAGTVTLAEYLSRLDPRHLTASHEPWPARWEHVLGNARRAGLPIDFAVRSTFRALRRARLGHLSQELLYIEVNPHLASMIELLPELVAPLHMTQIVREPGAWVESILGFGASGWRRHVIEWAPWARPAPVPRPPGWSRMGPGERMLWRWRAINEAIEALRPAAASFECIRFEDLFASDTSTCEAGLAGVHRGLALDHCPSVALLRELGTLNARAPVAVAGRRVPRPLIEDVCGDLLRRYGYA
jgi:hypothetical protein